MGFRVFVLIISLPFFLQCGSGLVLKNTEDVLDLLEESNSNQSRQGAGSSASSTNSNQNLDYYGLTDSPTGTNTTGAVGTTVGNPLGR